MSSPNGRKRPQLKNSKSVANVSSPRERSKSKSKKKGGKAKKELEINFNNPVTRTRHASVQATSSVSKSKSKSPPPNSKSKLKQHSSTRNLNKDNKKKSGKNSLGPGPKPQMRRNKSAKALSINTDNPTSPRSKNNKNKSSKLNNLKNKRKSQMLPSSPTSPSKNKSKTNNLKNKRKSAVLSTQISKSEGADIDGDTDRPKHLRIRPVATEDITTKIYARVRSLMPWEPNKVSVKIMGNKVQNKTNRTMNEYMFSKVFTPQDDNTKVFKTVVMPMISNVLQGFNAVLIAYGQTGSGKTYSMLGKPKQNIVGLLPMMLEHMVKSKSVTKVELSAVEAFAYHVAKIELFDLFNKDNQTQIWADKVGSTSLNMLEATTVQIEDANDAHAKIVYAHAASHFAPTGKNPESSRGHVTFVAKVTQSQSQHSKLVSYFVFVDCAGSEGESAFTPDFIAAVSKEALMARRLEAGCINTGLSQLQIIFNELRVKGELNATLGNGLRRVLHPYINTQTFLSVLFALSPSVNNQKATESTLKFAVTAGMVKVKPIQKKGVLDFDSIVKELREHIARQEKEMELNNDTIDDLMNKIERAKIVSEQMKVKKARDASSPTTPTDLDDEKISQLVANKSNKDNHQRLSSNVPLDVAVQLVQIDEEEKRIENEYGKGVAAKRASLAALKETQAVTAKSAFAELQEKLAQKNAQPRDLDKFKKFEKIRTKSWQALAKDTISLELDENVNTEQEEDYKSLKERKNQIREMSEEELRMYVGELQSLYMQEKITYKGLAMSTGAIIDFLHGEYEGMLKFFQVRKILPKEVPEFDNNLIM